MPPVQPVPETSTQPVPEAQRIERNDISVKLLTDKAEKNPILRFDKYRDVLLNLIVDSDPKFSIGIYGEWGTGKTTLMKIVKDKLTDKKNIPVIWFNAWKYENDKNLMIISLLKAIVFGMSEEPEFKKLKRTILGTIVNLDKGIVDRFGLSEKHEDIFDNEKNSIYFDGIAKIEKDLTTLRQKDEKIRIVVFIDDLDRCSPDRTAEVFESIKGFLDIPGLIYVIGLSQETLAKFLAARYKDTGIDIENYIKKIIQMSIQIPEWTKDDIKDLVERLASDIGSKYSKLISNNKELISYGVELNPRELKRFINWFIMAGQIFFEDEGIIKPGSPQSKKYRELLVVQILRLRWQSYSKLFIDFQITKNNKEVITGLIDEEDDRRRAKLNYHKDDISDEIFEILANSIEDKDFWEFLKKSRDIVLSIENWNVYLRPSDATFVIGDLKKTLIKSFKTTDFSQVVSSVLENLINQNIKTGTDVTTTTTKQA